MKLDLGQLERLTALVNFEKDVFYASELENFPSGKGAQINSLHLGGWIEETGNTKETWFQISEDTMKKGIVKEWRKTRKAIERLPRIVELLDEVYELLDKKI